MMDAATKARFVLQLHKHSLQALDMGGFAGVPGAPTQMASNNIGFGGLSNAPGNPGGSTALAGPGTSAVNPNAVNPNNSFLGSIGNALGLNDNFQAGAANIQSGTNTAQLNNAYSGAQSGLAGQSQFANQAAGVNGFGNQSSILAQQQGLASQLQNEANGNGPNPAQAALAQSTGQNVANQGALMASQRGASSNTGLIARQAAQQGAATQQQAVGQGATLQAQQQLAAQSALANQQAQEQSVAANQIAAQGQGANAYSNAAQNEQGVLQGANTSYNNAGVSMQGNINNTNASTAAANQNQSGNIFGAITNAGSALTGGLIPKSAAKGGLITKYASGGSVDAQTIQYPSIQFASGGLATPALTPPGGGPQSFVGQWLNSGSSSGAAGPSIPSVSLPQFQDEGWLGGGEKSTTPSATSGSGDSVGLSQDMVDSVGSGGGAATGEMSAVPAAAAVAKGGMIGSRLDAKGGKVKPQNKNEKAVKPDNSYANDKVPALLSEGEIVIPRSITTHPQAPQMAAQFVQAVLNKRRMGKTA